MSIQSEAALENGLIDTLQKMNYEYVHIEEEKNLYDNFKRQLEKPLKKVVNTDFYVLTNEEKPIEPRTYCNYYHRLMKRLDIPRLKYHGLNHNKIFYWLNISELSTLKNVTANDLETSYILFLSQLCNIQRTL